LVLEANHDPVMLRQGPYPPALRRRVGGSFGHLSNQQAAELLDAVRHTALKRVLLAHVSRKNNRPELALAAVQAVDERLAPAVSVATQDRCTGWIQP
jgi:phosphoribosyl 1,2-cyclic phosphodiesterase